jgi:hypothetical protein
VTSQPPVVIVGVGRSGSTLLYRLLSLHPRAAWITGVANRVRPGSPANHLVMVAASVPGLGRPIRNRLRPSEAYPFWERIAPGFSTPDHDLRADEVDPSVAASAPALLRSMATRRRPTLVLKVSGWPRMGYLDALLGGPRFIHIVRDGRAVATSLLGQGWWWGHRWREDWQMGELPPDAAAAWEASGRSPYVLAAIQWRIQTSAVEEARSTIAAERFTAVRYEDLCADPTAVMARLLAFAGFPDHPAMTRALARETVRPAAQTWRGTVDEADLEIATPVMESQLRRYGYPV